MACQPISNQFPRLKQAVDIVINCYLMSFTLRCKYVQCRPIIIVICVMHMHMTNESKVSNCEFLPAAAPGGTTHHHMDVRHIHIVLTCHLIDISTYGHTVWTY